MLEGRKRFAAHVAKVASEKVHASMNAHGWNVCRRVFRTSPSAAVYLPGDGGNQSSGSRCMARSLNDRSHQVAGMWSLKVRNQPVIAVMGRNLGGRSVPDSYSGTGCSTIVCKKKINSISACNTHLNHFH